MDDPVFLDISRSAEEINKLIAGGSLSDVFPILQYLPSRVLTLIRTTLDRFLGYLHENLQEHRAEFDPGEFF